MRSVKTLALFALIALPCHGAISRNGSADLGNGTGTTYSNAYTVGSGSNRILFVYVEGDSSSDLITGCTYNSVSMSLVGKITPNQGGTPDRWLYMFYLMAPATGSNTVACSASSSSFMSLLAIDYDGVDQGGLDNSTTNGASNVTLITTSLTTTANNSWTVMAMQGYSGGVPCDTGGGGACNTASHRVVYDVANLSGAMYDSNGPVTPAGSTNLLGGYSTTGYDVTTVMASFAPAAGGGSTSNSPSKGGIF